MFYEHLDFAEALETLAHKAGVTLTRRVAPTEESRIKERMYEVNHLASEYYHYLLTKHKVGENARAYVKTRGISDKSIVTFGIGYSPNTWDGLSAYLVKKDMTINFSRQQDLSSRVGEGITTDFVGDSCLL